MSISCREAPPALLCSLNIHNVTTDATGLINLDLGKGTAKTGTLSGVNWGNGTYYLKISVDGVSVSTSQLLSVPYALYAEKAGNGFSGSYNDLSNKPALFDGTAKKLTVAQAKQLQWMKPCLR